MWLLVFFVSLVVGERTKFVYNSSDLSYLSNGIQFPVPPTEILLHDSSVLDELYRENQNVSEVRWLAELFNHFKWNLILTKLNETECKRNIQNYLENLQNGTSWAAKMYDASGRYSGQFFFGNDYWLGSKTLCQELINPSTNLEVPSFPVSFHVAKIRVNINHKLTPVTRQLNVGECLPSSCTTSDLRLLLNQERKSGTTLNIVGIRQIPGDYNLLQDFKFQLIGGIFLVIALLILVASITEHILSKPAKPQKVDLEIANNNNNEPPKKQTQKTQNLPLRFLLSFSAIGNTQKIFNFSSLSEDSIKCIHGLRFFSIGWIIMVHTYLEVFSIGDNKNIRILTERTFMYQTIANGTFSVDTFFYISGLLVTITYFRSLKPQKLTKCEAVKTGIGKFFILVMYRFFRLTPPYLFVLGVNEIILRYLHSNSVFTPAIIDHVSCDKYWWRNALYINNFFPQTDFCMLWSWYIANDTQFYLIAAILLLIAGRGSKHLKFAASALFTFLLTSWILTFIIAMKFEYVIRVEEPFALFDQLYDKPWMRIGPYFIGMLTGYYLYRWKSSLSCLAKSWIVIGWICSILCLLSLVYGVGRHGLVVPVSAFYASLGHTAWSLALAWITVACCEGYGGPVDCLLKFKLFLPLSRLTYCAYLIHPVLMCLTSFALDGPLHIHELFVIVIYCGNLIFSFVAAFVITIFFEAPVVNLLKIIF